MWARNNNQGAYVTVYWVEPIIFKLVAGKYMKDRVMLSKCMQKLFHANKYIISSVNLSSKL